MDSSLFAAYAPAVNAFLSGDTDKKCKTWEEVVNMFFAMNVDSTMTELTNFASVFIHSPKPDFFTINPSLINPYIENYICTKKDLLDEDYTEHVDFIEDESGIRITFSAFRRLAFSHSGERNYFTYEFIDKIFQIYLRYRTKMIIRGKLPTHWTLVERESKFTASMKPHEPKKGEPLMNEQPKVYYILKGTAKQIHAKFRSYKKDPSKGYTIEPHIPIYETVAANANTEITTVLQYLDWYYSRPYRVAYIEDRERRNKSAVNIDTAKHSIKLHKSFILIDPSQQVYTPDMLVTHIADIRMKLKQGKCLFNEEDKSSLILQARVSKKHKDFENNFTDIKIFERTNGKFIDDLNLYELNPCFDDIALIDTSNVLMPQTTPIVAESDVDQSDVDSVASRMTARPRATSRDSSKAPRRRRLSTQDTVLTNEDEELTTRPRAASGALRSRTNTLVSIPDDAPLMSSITGGKYESEDSEDDN